jgi:membrane-bound lytic murein transglycosylase D
LQNIDSHRGALASWTAWVAPRTLKPADAAREVGMSEAALRDANHIPNGMLIKAGSTLLVQRAGHIGADVPEQLADSAMIAFAPAAPALRRTSFKVGRKGDSVAAVARRYGTSPVQSRFKAGETVVVMVATRKKAAVAVRPAASKTAAAKPTAKKAVAAKNAPTTQRSGVKVAKQ